MEYHDFVKLFTSLTLCEDLSSQYSCWKMQARWAAELGNNGGYPNQGTTEEEYERFSKNPQVIITIQKSTSLFLLLSQPNARVIADHRYRYPFTGINFSVGFGVFKLKEGQNQLKDIRASEKLTSPILSAGRELSRSFQLSPGRYAIVVFADTSRVEAAFTLKMFLDCGESNVNLSSVNGTGIEKCKKQEPIAVSPDLKDILLLKSQKAQYIDQKKIGLSGMLKE